MPGVLSLKLTLGVLNAFAIVIVASLTLSISLSTSLSALGAIGERHARTLMSIARYDTELMFGRGTDVVGTISNLTASQDWVPPTSTTQPMAANRTLDTILGAVHAAFIRGVSQFRSVSVFLGDGSDIHATQGSSAHDEYVLQLNIPPRPLDNTSTANNSVSVRWRKTYDKATHRLLTPEWYRSGIPSSPSPLLPLWAEFTQGTFNGYAPVVFPPNSFIDPDDLSLSSVTGAIAPFYAPSAPSRTLEHLGGFVLVTFGLDSLTAFVNEAKATAMTEAFAYDSLGYLLAATPAAPVYDVLPDSTSIPTGCSSTSRLSDPGTDPSTFRLVCQRRITAYPHPDLNAVAASGDRALVYPPTGAAPVVAMVVPGAGRTFVASARVSMAFRGLEVYLMLLMPEADVLGDVITGRNIAIGVTCALVVVFAALNAVVAWVLLAPLGAVAARMERAASFEDDAVVPSVSAMSEVAALQNAYYAMNCELNHIRSFVPQSVLAARRADRNTGDGGEDDPDMASLDDGADPLTTIPSDAQDQSISLERSSQSLRRLSLSKSQPPQGSSPQTPRRAVTFAPAAETLTMRNVSLVCGNVVGLHEAAGATPSAVGDDLAAFIGLVEAAVATERGVVTFHGDRFLAAFNTSRPCVSHAVRAASAALRISGTVNERSTSLRPTFRLPVSCGVASGRCAVGSVGSATLKTMSAVGPAVAHAATLERYAQALVSARGDVSGVAVASQRSVREMTGSPITAKFIDLVDLRGWTTTSATIVPSAVAELLAPPAVTDPAARPQGRDGDGEWLYLVSGSEADPRLAFNAVFMQLASGAFDAAQSIYAALSATDDDVDDTRGLPGAPSVLRDLLGPTSPAPTADRLRELCWAPRRELRTRVTSQY